MSRVPYDLTDKVVPITGGNGGIGAASARALLDRGAKVGIADIEPAARRMWAAEIAGRLVSGKDTKPVHEYWSGHVFKSEAGGILLWLEGHH